ncbi:hypothetical protein GCM10011352_02980 [Marinobacterium zhoushanense]|uniref:Uncharacterized protein n=1 Tax=Marinobacterium zhoushanense TaxID=1679163 RepID=A0ABQ1JXT4_9GAMM|nr:hypothetical protein [Marinobacterium zhoushanense]GGB80684.1 hypothetical protein GCM10011352_02980 [Marinobacterium zhoushanense]
MFKVKTALATALCALALSAPAFASHCPVDAKSIDAALTKMELSDEVKAEVQALRDEGMKQHEAGKHHDAEKTLAQAMRMLLDSVSM